MWGLEKISLVVDRRDISYLKFIIEGYDGLGIVTTQDPYTAKVMVMYPHSRKQTLLDLMDALRKKGVVREVIE